MIPWWIVSIIIFLFLIREIRYKANDTDYDGGYIQAYLEVCEEWDEIDKTHRYLDFNDFLIAKLERMGR